MSTIFTARGSLIDFLNPEFSKFSMVEIAESLAKECRFANHTLDCHYSVAEHSVHAARLAPHFGVEPLAALLHDAPEAYMRDVPTPLKNLLPEYQRIHDGILEEIFKINHLSIRDHYTPGLEKLDKDLTSKEGMELTLNKHWKGRTISPFVARVKLHKWERNQARHEWLQLYSVLGHAHRDKVGA